MKKEKRNKETKEKIRTIRIDYEYHKKQMEYFKAVYKIITGENLK